MSISDKNVYKWYVKAGSILLFDNGDKIHFELDREGHEKCLCTEEDTKELINILTSVSRDIWERPDIIKEPYTQQLYKVGSDGVIYWDIDKTRLFVSFNSEVKALEINYTGEPALEIPLNHSVEIIQILSHFYQQF